MLKAGKSHGLSSCDLQLLDWERADSVGHGSLLPRSWSVRGAAGVQLELCAGSALLAVPLCWPSFPSRLLCLEMCLTMAAVAAALRRRPGCSSVRVSEGFAAGAQTAFSGVMPLLRGVFPPSVSLEKQGFLLVVFVLPHSRCVCSWQSAARGTYITGRICDCGWGAYWFCVLYFGSRDQHSWAESSGFLPPVPSLAKTA